MTLGSLGTFRKISLREAARKIGISATHLNDIEKGKRLPSIEVYNKIKEADIYEDTFFDFFNVVTVQKVIHKMF